MAKRRENKGPAPGSANQRHRAGKEQSTDAEQVEGKGGEEGRWIKKGEGGWGEGEPGEEGEQGREERRRGEEG